MSTCISNHGEYSTHDIDEDYICQRCHTLDEDLIVDELNRLRAALRTTRAQVLAEVDAALRDDRLAEIVALATAEHHLGNLTAMGDDGCVCGQWADGKDVPGWDDHMADVSLAAIADYLRDTLTPDAEEA